MEPPGTELLVYTTRPDTVHLSLPASNDEPVVPAVRESQLCKAPTRASARRSCAERLPLHGALFSSDPILSTPLVDVDVDVSA